MSRVDSVQVGARFERLVVTDDIGFKVVSGRSRRLVRCRCNCGNSVDVPAIYLVKTTRPTRSCGCLMRERSSESSKTHGMKGTKEYATWTGMRDRCNNPNGKDVERYRNRGIKICKRWGKFEIFFSDMGLAPSKLHSIDRIDNSKGYSPSNCRWATPKDQARNRRGNLLLTVNGKKMCASAVDEMCGFYRGTTARRIRKFGWSAERIINTPTPTSERNYNE